ncbi:MAG: hypothetical protein PHQ05_05040 [Sterolibacterium sp.]|nr:hypothetical protein [Sterolibacterium sp.]
MTPKHVNHREPGMSLAPRAEPMEIFILGSSYSRGDAPDERARLLFCNHLVAFADLDAYPRRAQFIAAYSTGGSLDARRLEAMYLAEADILSAHEIADCVDWAEEESDPWAANGLTPEIV